MWSSAILSRRGGMNAHLDPGLERLILSRQPRLTAIPGLFPFAHFSNWPLADSNWATASEGQYPALHPAGIIVGHPPGGVAANCSLRSLDLQYLLRSTTQRGPRLHTGWRRSRRRMQDLVGCLAFQATD